MPADTDADGHGPLGGDGAKPDMVAEAQDAAAEALTPGQDAAGYASEVSTQAYADAADQGEVVPDRRRKSVGGMRKTTTLAGKKRSGNVTGRASHLSQPTTTLDISQFMGSTRRSPRALPNLGTVRMVSHRSRHISPPPLCMPTIICGRLRIARLMAWFIHLLSLVLLLRPLYPVNHRRHLRHPARSTTTGIETLGPGKARNITPLSSKP